MAIIIRGCGKAVPKKQVSNDELCKLIDSSDEWIRSHSGIGNRYVSDASETSSTLATEACLNALLHAEIDVKPEEIDILLCATATPDYAGCPATACLVQNNIGAVNAAAFDISAACSGFICALETASGFLERQNRRYALVCGTETLSKIIDRNDRSTYVLFGDGAGAVLVENTECRTAQTCSAAVTCSAAETCGEKRGISSVILGADGSGGKDLFVNENHFLSMNGQAVYKFAVKTIADLITALMERESLSFDDVDLFVCHQANLRILQAAAKRINLPYEKVVENIEQYGNTSAASIPITLADLTQSGRLKHGMTILAAGFGGGLTWGGCVIRW